MNVAGQIIGYARVSTEEQSDDEGALVKQLRRLRENGATQLFYDVGQRTNDKRLGINQTIEYIAASRDGAVAKLIFTRLDRLSASPILFYRLVDICRNKRVELQALDDSFDVSTVGGEFSADVRIAVAKHEVRMISLRVRKDLEVRAKLNKPHYFAPFGYRVVGENYDRYEKDDTPLVCLLNGKREMTVADVARLRIDIFFEAGTVRGAAKRLNEIFGIARVSPIIRNAEVKTNSITDEEISNDLWAPSKQSRMVFSNRLSITSTGLQNWLVNPILAGGVPRNKTKSSEGKKSNRPRNQWSVTWNVHPSEAIISLAERNKILEIFAHNKENRWVSDTPKVCNVFSGLVRCGQCGSSCSIQGTKFRKLINRNISYFQCNYYRNDGLCKNKTMISDIEIEKQLTPLLIKEAERLSVLGEEISPTQEDSEVTELRCQLSQLKAISKPNFAILKAIEDLESQINSAAAQKHNQDRQMIIAKERIVAAFSNPAFWESIDSPADKKRLLGEVILEIRVDAKKVQSVKYRS